MFFPRFIKWLARLPAPYALGLLWWAEATIILCSLAGGWLMSVWLFDHIKPSLRILLFPIALVTYFLIFYLLHFTFSKVSELMEALMHIHRIGGPIQVERLLSRERAMRQEEVEEGEMPDPYEPPERIRASAEQFKIRYFVVLPTALVLYLLSFASTIYRIFARQFQTWEPGLLVAHAFASVIVACVCYWLLMPSLPGYVSVRRLLGQKKPEEKQ
jgi:uncharacterized membrane protein YqhA